VKLSDETFPPGKFIEKQMSDEIRTTSKKRRENVSLLLGFAFALFNVVNLSKNVIANQGHVCVVYVTPSSQETHCDVTVNKESIKKIYIQHHFVFIFLKIHSISL
jgi:endonuclease V-like protein UPF0215 family